MGAKKEALILKALEERARFDRPPADGRSARDGRGAGRRAARARARRRHLPGRQPAPRLRDLRRPRHPRGRRSAVADGRVHGLQARRARPRARRDQVERAALGRLPGRPAARAAREPRRRAAVLHRLEGAQHRAARSRDPARASSSTSTASSGTTTAQLVAGASEEEIYEALGPRLRPAGAAREPRRDRGRRARRAATPADARGPARRPAHAHDRHRRPRRRRNDGARRARPPGSSYIAITDHSQALAMANGLDERARARTRAPRSASSNARLDGITVLAGIECDIRADGTMDLADDCLAAARHRHRLGPLRVHPGRERR